MMPGSNTNWILDGKLHGVPQKLEIFSFSAKWLARLGFHRHLAVQVKRPEQLQKMIGRWPYIFSRPSA
jgi:hypothetical protein